jgi:preprotein translocase subunit SecD
VVAVVGPTLDKQLLNPAIGTVSALCLEFGFRPVLAALPPLPRTSAKTTVAPGADAAVASCDVNRIAALPWVPTTSRVHENQDGCAVLSFSRGQGVGRLYLGPTQLTGRDIDSASPRFASRQGYVIDMDLTRSGLRKFNELASTSFGKTPAQDEVAIVVDGKVQSNPAFQDATFSGSVEISGKFSQSEALNLAKLINYGAVP